MDVGAAALSGGGRPFGSVAAPHRAGEAATQSSVSSGRPWEPLRSLAPVLHGERAPAAGVALARPAQKAPSEPPRAAVSRAGGVCPRLCPAFALSLAPPAGSWVCHSSSDILLVEAEGPAEGQGARHTGQGAGTPEYTPGGHYQAGRTPWASPLRRSHLDHGGKVWPLPSGPGTAHRGRNTPPLSPSSLVCLLEAFLWW